MELRELRHFAAVARSRTLTEAAASLFITQSALSMSVRRLEDELGVALFIREKRRLSLSPEGAKLLAAAEKVLAAADGLRAEASALRADSAPPPLRIAFCDPGPYWFFAPRVAAALPDMLLEPVLAVNGGALALLEAGGCEAAVLSPKPDNRTGLVFSPLAEDRLFLSVPSGRLAGFRLERLRETPEKDRPELCLRDLPAEAEILSLELDGTFSRRTRALLHCEPGSGPAIRHFSDYFLFQQEIGDPPAATFTTRLVRHFRPDAGKRELFPVAGDEARIRYWLAWKASSAETGRIRRFAETAARFAAGTGTAFEDPRP